jgi:hypothetical protein
VFNLESHVPIPANAPAKADINNPVGPTPTWIGNVPSAFCEFINVIIDVDKKSNTKNFATANGNSLDRMGAKPDKSGDISLIRRDLKSNDAFVCEY